MLLTSAYLFFSTLRPNTDTSPLERQNNKFIRIKGLPSSNINTIQVRFRKVALLRWIIASLID